MMVSDPVASLTVEAAVERDSEIISQIEFQLLLDPPARVQMVAVPQFRDRGNDHEVKRKKDTHSFLGIPAVQCTDDGEQNVRVGAQDDLSVSVVTRCAEVAQDASNATLFSGSNVEQKSSCTSSNLAVVNDDVTQSAKMVNLEENRPSYFPSVDPEHKALGSTRAEEQSTAYGILEVGRKLQVSNDNN